MYQLNDVNYPSYCNVIPFLWSGQTGCEFRPCKPDDHMNVNGFVSPACIAGYWVNLLPIALTIGLAGMFIIGFKVL